MIKLENCEVMGWEAAIHELYKGKGVRWVYPNSYLGRLFGVDKSTVSAIVHNETWREQNDKN